MCETIQPNPENIYFDLTAYRYWRESEALLSEMKTAGWRFIKLTNPDAVAQHLNPMPYSAHEHAN